MAATAAAAVVLATAAVVAVLAVAAAAVAVSAPRWPVRDAEWPGVSAAHGAPRLPTLRAALSTPSALAVTAWTAFVRPQRRRGPERRPVARGRTPAAAAKTRRPLPRPRGRHRGTSAWGRAGVVVPLGGWHRCCGAVRRGMTRRLFRRRAFAPRLTARFVLRRTVLGLAFCAQPQGGGAACGATRHRRHCCCAAAAASLPPANSTPRRSPCRGGLAAVGHCAWGSPASTLEWRRWWWRRQGDCLTLWGGPTGNLGRVILAVAGYPGPGSAGL